MSEIASDKKQTDCINGKFINDDTFVNNIIKGEALAALGDRNEKSDKLTSVESFAEEFITTAISSCLGTSNGGE
jgi:predicted amino acid racemase